MMRWVRAAVRSCTAPGRVGEAQVRAGKIRARGEKAIATPKTWKILLKLRCCPRRATTIVHAILVPHDIEPNRYTGWEGSISGGVVRRFRPVRTEDFLDGQAEDVGDGERQRQAGIVPLGFDGVDGLPGDVAPVGQVGLAPPASCTQFA